MGRREREEEESIGFTAARRRRLNTATSNGHHHLVRPLLPSERAQCAAAESAAIKDAPDRVTTKSVKTRSTASRYTAVPCNRPFEKPRQPVSSVRKPCTYSLSLSSTAALLFAQWEVTDNF